MEAKRKEKHCCHKLYEASTSICENKDSQMKRKYNYQDDESVEPIKSLKCKENAFLTTSPPYNVKNSDDFVDWKSHKMNLSKLFFSESDIIQRNSDDYDDFWKFAIKYQTINQEKKTELNLLNNSLCELRSEWHELPLIYDKSSCLNFTLEGKEPHQIKGKLGSVDDSFKKLSESKFSEFLSIILLYLDFVQKQKFLKLKKIRDAQKNLPIFQYKSQILKTVEENTVTILAGDTGCGKSTQIPQYLLDTGFTNIACTQPRRIACISLSKRVAFETLNEYGSSVGFQIRFEKKKTEHTKIVFVTEGLLLKQISSDPMLLKYNVLILDEIHERHLQTDFLLGVIRCLIVQRPEIKIILMSATINIDLFSSYFMNKAPVILIPGRLYPIEMKYFPISIVEKSSKNEKINPAPYIRILQLIDNSYPSNERGDVLIFLSGVKEITVIVEAARLYAQQCNRWVILPLHSTLSVSEQEKVFNIPPEGIRKCIVSTNIAETSVTIDGVRFVVDSGKVKEMDFDPIHKMERLNEFWISQASAEQRKGRSGRTGPGVCFRLYSESEYSSFSAYTKPEIMRVSLDSLILQMMAMGLPNIKLFPFIEPPPEDSLDISLLSLKSHAALESNEKLTSLGELLAKLPLDVSLGKMLIMGTLFHQLGPVVSLAAAMSVQSPFTNRAHRDPDCVLLNDELHSDLGDPFTLLNVYREWLYIKTKGEERSSRWCKKRGLEEQRFYEITKLRQQFMHMLQENGMQTLGEDRNMTSADRAKRNGELYQLRRMKRELHKHDIKKKHLLKLDSECGASVGDDDEDDTDVSLKIKDVDFQIRYDDAKLRELYRDSKVSSLTELILLQVILCSGLYPNIAIPDEHNNYKPGSDQVFHTFRKPFVVLHPNSVFASKPQHLQITQSDIVTMKGFSERNPCSCRHQLLIFVSLLETNKVYLMNSFRLPAAQTLLLFSHAIDTNADCSRLVFDNFIELRIVERVAAQNLLFEAVSLRSKWKNLLEMRIRASKTSVEDKKSMNDKAHHLQKDISAALIDFFKKELYCSTRRLLAAEVKVLYRGIGANSPILHPNPFSEKDDPCLPHSTKGGVVLTEFLTYDSLADADSEATTMTSFIAVCSFCDQEIDSTTLERLRHMKKCATSFIDRQSRSESTSKIEQNHKEFWCHVCQRKFSLSVKDILKHKKTHIS